MSFLAEAYVLEKYGMRLTMRQLAEVLGIGYGTLRNKQSQGTFKIPTYVEDGTRFADYRDVVEYLDSRRPKKPGEDGYTASDSASPGGRSPRRPVESPAPPQTVG